MEVLNAIYETDFLGFSYGFRPGRSQHDALDALAFGITRRAVNWVLDADIRAFFDSISHAWMMRFLEHRIGDRRVLRLIAKWLKAGVMEEGALTESTEGTPQGAVISPLLANIYLHYVYDLWADQWRKREATGEVIVVRYADDTIVGFERQADAERFLRDLRERLAKFGLALHPDKTRLIEFGRHAAQRRSARGEGKPETFDFLGFTHICGKAKEGGWFTLVRHTIAKRMRARTRRDQGGAEPHAPRAGARTGRAGWGRWCGATSRTSPCRPIRGRSRPSNITSRGTGDARSRAEARRPTSRGRGWGGSPRVGCHPPGSAIPGRSIASSSNTRGGSRVR